MGGEGALSLFDGTIRGLLNLFLNFIEADGGLKHEENIKTLLANVFDDTGNILRLRDGLVNRFA